MTFQTRRIEFTEPKVVTLEDVMDRIASAVSLTARQKREIASALNAISRWHHQPLSQIPAGHDYLRRFFSQVNFGTLGVGRARIQNVQSLLKRGLAVGDVPTPGRKKNSPAMTSEWLALRNQIEARHARDCFGRFARFCSARAIAPGQVDDVVVGLYRETLATEDLAARPEAAVQSVVRIWNRVAEEVPGWPQTRLAPLLRRETYTLRWEEVLPDLVAELEAYLAILGGADPMHPLAPPRPLKPRSIFKRRYEFLQLISGMKHQGVCIDDLHRLTDLCDPERVRKGLNFFILRHRQRHGQDSDPATSTMISGIADAVRALAKHYVQASERTVAELTRIAGRLRRRRQGMTEKNRMRLAQLDSSLVEAKFLSYPRAEMQRLAKKKIVTRRDAARFGVLLGIEIFIGAPMRSENLAELDLQKNFVWPPHRQAEIGIVIPRKDVKNAVPLEYKVPAGSVWAFNTYVNRFRPLLAKNGSSALFPNPSGRSKRPDTISKQITKLIHNELGIAWNAHIFRHFAARLYLRAHPGDYEGVRRLLAHLSTETTFRSYEGGEMRPVVDSYDALLESKRGSGSLAPKRRNRR